MNIWETENLTKHFVIRHGLLKQHKQVVHALAGVSLHQGVGETLGIVGESGCGKSTFGRTLMGLYPKTAGRLIVGGREILGKADQAHILSHIQMVFQDPYASLNPRMTVRQSLLEPLTVRTIGDVLSEVDKQAKVEAVLEQVGLSKAQGERYPHEFSGGQRQRIGIGRALISSPQCIICDEPISALDVSIQVQIISLLERLQAEQGISYVFISHDLNMVRYVSQRMAVMYLGGIVEEGPTKSIYATPLHPYTQALIKLNAPLAPHMAIGPVLTGEVPSPLENLRGCSFATRCPEKMAQCEEARPPLVVHGDQKVACWRR